MMPLRIAMIGQKGIPARHGGVERAVEEIGARLVERGHQVTVFNKRDPDQPRTVEHRGITIENVLGTSGKFTGNLSISLASTLRSLWHRYDIVHYHALGPTILSPLARLRPGVKVVATVHGRDDLRAKWGGAAQRMLRMAAWVTAHVPHEVIVVSRDLVEDFARAWGRTTVYIPNGVEVPDDAVIDLRTPEILTRLGVADSDYLLSVGRLVPEKAIDDLLSAFARTDLPTRLVVVGGTSGAVDYERYLEQLGRADPRVVLAGSVYGDGLDVLYRHAAGFVMPSRLEGLPLALLEAAGRGTPVVCSDIAPHQEILGGSGPGHRMYPSGDQDELRDALVELFANIEAARRGAMDCRVSVLSRYSWDDAVRALEDLYLRLVDA